MKLWSSDRKRWSTTPQGSGTQLSIQQSPIIMKSPAGLASQF